MEDDGKRIEIPKTPVQERLNKLQADAKLKAGQSPIRELEVDLPDDIDKNRLIQIANEIKETDTPHGKVVEVTPKGVPVVIPASTKNIPEDIAEGEIQLLVLSVTDIPFIPAKVKNSEEAPQPVTKFNILVESTQPLQLGKTYLIKA